MLIVKDLQFGGTVFVLETESGLNKARLLDHNRLN